MKHRWIEGVHIADLGIQAHFRKLAVHFADFFTMPFLSSFRTGIIIGVAFYITI